MKSRFGGYIYPKIIVKFRDENKSILDGGKWVRSLVLRDLLCSPINAIPKPARSSFIHRRINWFRHATYSHIATALCKYAKTFCTT